MAKPPKSLFICTNCDAQFQKWTGRCLECGAWGSVQEEAAPVITSAPSAQTTATLHPALTLAKLSHITGKSTPRRPTTITELDRVLGGGIVTGSFILLAGEPGIGKSTLAIQLAAIVPNTLYVSGEESVEQIKLRADRLGIMSNTLSLANAMHTESVVATIVKEKPTLCVVDSVQTLVCTDIPSEAGSPSQVRASATKLMEAAKSTGTTVVLIGHVTKDGTVAGPKTLEHLVDVVLQLEGDRNRDIRLLRTPKNRFGSTDEVGMFTMEKAGLMALGNPSKLLLEERGEHVSGSIMTCLMEGTRPVLVELQALVNKTSFGYPVRKSSGFDLNRLHVLIAVLERRVGLKLSEFDVHINVVGGIKAEEPAADLAVCLAIASAYKDKAVGADVVAFGEVGLGGEIRSARFSEKRIKECESLGMKTVYASKQKKLPNGTLLVKSAGSLSELIA